MTAVWEGRPESVETQVKTALRALHSDDRTQIALGCWALVVASPRAVLHLLSWALEHPLRTLAAALLLGILIGSLTA